MQPQDGVLTSMEKKQSTSRYFCFHPQLSVFSAPCVLNTHQVHIQIPPDSAATAWVVVLVTVASANPHSTIKGTIMTIKGILTCSSHSATAQHETYIVGRRNLDV